MSAAKTQILLALLVIFASLLQANNSTFSCFGKADQDPKVCSGNGICQNYNTCTCNLSYFGAECEIMAPRYMISTIAGTGTLGYDRDVGLATNTSIYAPQGVAVSDIGEVYIADTFNHVIRKVYLNGTMKIIAGTGAQSYSGNDGPALNCAFNSPIGLSLSRSNSDLFIADSNNNVIRKLELESGIIRQSVGGGSKGYTTPGAGNAYNGWYNVIRSVSISGNNGDELIFTDSDNNQIRKAYQNGLSDICGSAQIKSYLGYGGPAIDSWIGVPYQVSVSVEQDIYFTDIYLNIVSRVKKSTGIIDRVIGSASASGFDGDGGLAVDALISTPKGIAVSPSGELFLADTGNNRLRKVFTNGIIVTIAGSSTAGFSGDGGVSTNANLNLPVNVAIRQFRNLSEIYFADTGNHAIRKLTAFCDENYTLINGLCYVKCFEKTSQDEGVCSGRGNCSAVNQCSCTDGFYGANCEEFDCHGVNLNSSSVCSGNGVCSSPENCTCSTGYYGTNCELFDCFGVSSLDPSACSMHGKCSSFNNCSCSEGYYGQSCQSPKCFGIPSNDTLVCSSHGSCTDYNICNCSNGFYGESCQQFKCYGIPNDSPLVCSGQGKCSTIDQCACNITYFGSECEIMAPRYLISTIAGTGTLGYDRDVGLATNTSIYAPQGVAVSDIGEVYVADTFNHVIRKVYLNGTMKIIAGTGAQSYSGNDGPALNCAFNSPIGLSLSRSNGDLFIADSNNNVIRKLELESGIIRQYVGRGNRGYTTPGSGNAYNALFNIIRGVSISGSNGDELIFTDSDNNQIRKANQNYDLSDICGSAQIKSYLGYGGPAIDSWIGVPYQVSISVEQDIYFTDIYLNIVSRVKKSTGIIDRVIGSASASGFDGDGGLAVDALISTPKGIAVSPSGELFLADTGNNRLRKVFTNGVIVTIAGSSTAGFSGDGGISTNANLNLPVNVAIRQFRNSSEIYFADTGNHAIRKLTAFCDENYSLINGLCYLKCFEKTSQDEGVCSGRGNCSAVNQCTCTDGFYGANCEEFNCNGVSVKSSSVCSGNGMCSSPENCTCSTGYYGTNCELFDCFGMNSLAPSACSMHGKCSSFNNCSCNEGYYGQSCQSFKCFGIAPNDTLVCSSHGSCTDYNSCNCSNGYYGESCQQFNCYGIPQDSPSVCSGHGKCLTIDQCLCQNGYYGQDCSQFNCSGKQSNDPLVCSARGVCSSYDNCTCKEGYYGANCEEFNCFGMSKNSNKVCSTHGSCSSYNNCTCSNGYRGAMCEAYSCFGISSNSSSVCSGHGLCSTYNNCTCLDGYFGNDCRNFTCFNITQSSPNVCSSSGTCIAKDVCKCFDLNTSGDNCEILSYSSRVVNMAMTNNYYSFVMLFVSLIVGALIF